MGYKDFLIPILITLLAGLSTGIGSVAALFIREFKHRYLSLMLGFSTGVMVYVSFVDLLGSSIEVIGLFYLFSGGLFLFYKYCSGTYPNSEIHKTSIRMGISPSSEG